MKTGTRTNQLHVIIPSIMFIFILIFPSTFIVDSQSIIDDVTPLDLHQWNNSISFALFDIDTTSQITPTVQLITNDQSLVEPSTIIDVINNFIANRDNDPTKTLIAYSSWQNTSNAPMIEEEEFSSFYVTSVMPFFRSITYESSFPNLPSFNLSHYTIGMPSILTSFKGPNDQQFFFKHNFLGLMVKIYNSTNGSNSSQQEKQLRLFPSYLITNTNMLQILNETIGSLGAEIPSITSSLPLIQVQEKSIKYIINNPILVFQEQVPEEVVPFTNIYYPLSPQLILFSKNLTLTFSIEPYISPLGIHLILNTEITLSPIEWMLIQENVNVQEFNNAITVTLPALFDPLNQFTTSVSEFVFYHERNDIKKRLSHPLYPQVELSYVLGLQLISFNSSSQDILEAIIPSIDGKINTWDLETINHSISTNITYSYPQVNLNTINSMPLVIIPTITEALIFNETATLGKSSLTVTNFDRIVPAAWTLLNPQFFSVLNVNKNPYLNYFIENQQTYFVEAIIASIHSRFSTEQVPTLSRPALLEKLISLASEQQVLDVTIEQWNGEGFIHQTRSDLIQKLNVSALKFISNKSQESINGSNIVPSFSFPLTVYTSMLLAITYLIRRKNRLTR